MSKRTLSRTVVPFVLPMVLFAACSSSASRSTKSDATTSTVESTVPGSDETTTPSSVVSTDAATTAPPTTKAPAPTGAVVKSFTVSAPSVTCPSSDARTLTLSWKIINADSVFVGIDSPDKYEDVPLVGTLEVPFPCGASHTYYVVATKNGVQTVKSKTVN